LRIEPFETWLARRVEGRWVSGPGLRVHEGRLLASGQVVNSDLWDPRPESLLHLGLERFRQGQRDDFWSLEPLYLRASSAEEQVRAQQSRRPDR
jgi:hypothetical protein